MVLQQKMIRESLEFDLHHSLQGKVTSESLKELLSTATFETSASPLKVQWRKKCTRRPSVGIRGVFPAPLTTTPRLQLSSSQSSSNPNCEELSKFKTFEIEKQAEHVSDAESSRSSEIEEALSTSSQEQTSNPKVAAGFSAAREVEAALRNSQLRPTNPF